MKEFFKDFRGWLATAIFLAAILAVGFSKLLNRQTNLTIVILVVVAAVIVAVLNQPGKDAQPAELQAEQNNTKEQ